MQLLTPGDDADLVTAVNFFPAHLRSLVPVHETTSRQRKICLCILNYTSVSLLDFLQDLLGSLVAAVESLVEK